MDDPLKLADEVLNRALETERRNKRFLESIGPAIVLPIITALQESMVNIASTVKKQLESININPTFQVPEIKFPPLTLPEGKLPVINVAPAKLPPFPAIPAPQVTVKVPPIKVPRPEVTVKVPMNIQTNKKLDAIVDAILNQPTVNQNSMFDEVNFSRPLPVILTDHVGKPYKADQGGSGSGVIPPKKGLYLREYDYVALTQSDNQDIYTFKIGGSSGKAIGGITILYADATRATISTVTRT